MMPMMVSLMAGGARLGAIERLDAPVVFMALLAGVTAFSNPEMGPEVEFHSNAG